MNKLEEIMELHTERLIRLAYYYLFYAVSKDIQFSEATIVERQVLEREQFKVAIKNDTKMNEKIAKLHLTQDEFFEKYMMANALKWFAQSELMKEYYRKYENSYQLHAYFAVKKEAMDYFTAKYGQQIAYLENKYNVSKPNMSTKYKYGTVVAMEEDRFLVVTGALQEEIGRLSNEEMINKHTNGVWFPLLEVQQKITIGQNVNVTYSLQTQLNQYDFIANLDEIEISE